MCFLEIQHTYTNVGGENENRSLPPSLEMKPSDTKSTWKMCRETGRKERRVCKELFITSTMSSQAYRVVTSTNRW